MPKIKKILKDPMFIGASAGLVIGVSWTLIMVLYRIGCLSFPPLVGRLLLRIFFVSYPVFSLEFLMNTNLVPVYLEELAFFGSICIWYLQFGFFSGLFYRVLRKRYSRERSVLLLILAIVLITPIFLYTNRGWL